MTPGGAAVPVPLPAQVRRAAEEFVLADPHDAGAMTAIAGTFRQITAAATGEWPDAGELARSASALIERDILGSHERIGAAHAAVSRLLVSLQAAVEPGGAAASPHLVDAELLQEFLLEAREHLAEADARLLSLEQRPADPELLNAVFRSFHTIKGAAGFVGVQSIQDLAHATEDVLGMARAGELALTGSTVSLVFEVVDILRGLLSVLAGECSAEAGLEWSAKATALGPRLRLVAERRPDAAQGDAPLPERARNGIAALAETAPAESGARPAREVVRVDAARLDRLVDTIGELVIAESMVSQSDELRRVTSPRFLGQVGRLSKMTRSLQEMGMSLRMVSLKATFGRMARLARDLAWKSGKSVEFTTEGEDVELDKAIVDRLDEPLVHLVRNAMDHGIEAEGGERVRLGKPATARVRIRAFHRGGNIHLEVTDDGRGLDRQAIRARALERRLLPGGEAAADGALLRVIFEPGFSTAAQVTDVSGRGVGLDVVRRAIEAMRGAIDVVSTRGEGTTFAIRLPLTLAIIDGMVVRVGTERYVIPTVSVVRSVRPGGADVTSMAGKAELLRLGDRLVPLFRLAALLESAGAGRAMEDTLVVVVEDAGRQAGLVVDELIGQQQVVIKTLGQALASLPGISGGAIMPDGRVAAILDVAGLVRLAQSPGAVAGLRRSAPPFITAASSEAHATVTQGGRHV